MIIYNIPEHLKGDTWDGRVIQVIINGLPKDLTNTVIKIDFRWQKKTGTLVKSITNGSGIVITDALQGIFTIEPVQADFEAGTYYYDVQFNDGGLIKTYMGGEWPINQDTTK